MTPDAILAVVRRHIEHPDLIARLDVDASFSDLRLCGIDAWGIAVNIEDVLGRELDWRRVDTWCSVRDVVETVAALGVLTDGLAA